jgi:hypothetical protein
MKESEVKYKVKINYDRLSNGCVYGYFGRSEACSAAVIEVIDPIKESVDLGIKSVEEGDIKRLTKGNLIIR